MQIVPLEPTPNQVLTTTLAGQPVFLRVYARTQGLFLDLYVNGVLIIGGVLARNATRVVRETYLGFIGDLVFVDMNPDPVDGPTNPQVAELGSRYVLFYLAASELAGDC